MYFPPRVRQLEEIHQFIAQINATQKHQLRNSSNGITIASQPPAWCPHCHCWLAPIQQRPLLQQSSYWLWPALAQFRHCRRRIQAPTCCTARRRAGPSMLWGQCRWLLWVPCSFCPQKQYANAALIGIYHNATVKITAMYGMWSESKWERQMDKFNFGYAPAEVVNFAQD